MNLHSTETSTPPMRPSGGLSGALVPLLIILAIIAAGIYYALAGLFS